MSNLKNNNLNSSIIENHKHNGVFLIRSQQDCIATKDINQGYSIYGEKLLKGYLDSKPIIFRVWNPFRSKLAAAILCGIDCFSILKNNSILYLGASTGTTVSHLSDIIGEKGIIFAVEKSFSGFRKLYELSKTRPNIIPIFEDARYPYKYRMLISQVDLIFIDIAQADQTQILALNALYFLKNNGMFMMAIKASSIDSLTYSETIVAREIQKLINFGLKPIEQISLEPYERHHNMLSGTYKY